MANKKKVNKDKTKVKTKKTKGSKQSPRLVEREFQKVVDSKPGYRI
jgi:hypothetical protein